MPVFHFHQRFCGNSIRVNPWQPSQYILTAADNFGVSGSGKVYIVQVGEGPQGGAMSLIGGIGTADGAFDAAFNEVNGEIFVVACGDGIKAYSTRMLNSDAVGPLAHNVEHEAEVSAVAWNPANHQFFASASWDGSVKVFTAENILQSMCTVRVHMKQAYDVGWCPRNPFCLASAGGDGAVKIVDVRQKVEVMAIPNAHPGAIALSTSWNYYEPSVIATGGTDNMARVWDLRRAQSPLTQLAGHQGCVRRVRFSPHSRSQLLTSGYDFRVCHWDTDRQQPLCARYDHHREFVVGVEWSLLSPNGVCSASWDGTAAFWTLGHPVVPSPPVPMPPLMPPPKMPRAHQRGPPPGLAGVPPRPLPPLP